MKLRRWPIGALAVLMLLISNQELSADEWRELKQETAGIKTIQGDFVQTKSMKILLTPLESKGRFLYQAPDRVRWEYRSPVEVVSLVRGGDVRRYTRVAGGSWVLDSSGRVEAMRIVMEKITDWLTGNYGQDDAFDAALEAGPPRVVRLTPKTEGMRRFIQGVELIFSDRPGVVGTVRIDEGPDASTTIEFKDVRLNEALPETAFKDVE